MYTFFLFFIFLCHSKCLDWFAKFFFFWSAFPVTNLTLRCHLKEQARVFSSMTWVMNFCGIGVEKNKIYSLYFIHVRCERHSTSSVSFPLFLFCRVLIRQCPTIFMAQIQLLTEKDCLVNGAPDTTAKVLEGPRQKWALCPCPLETVRLPYDINTQFPIHSSPSFIFHRSWYFIQGNISLE